MASGNSHCINLHGIPKDLESAIALAQKQDDRTRKEFEKWAVLTYSNNRAVINSKKGKDEGIDGIAYFNGDQGKQEKIIFQVKSGKVHRTYAKYLSNPHFSVTSVPGVVRYSMNLA